MHILLISQYYPPEIGAAANRVGFFANYLASKGHAVTVLTTTPNYPEGIVYSGHKNRTNVRTEKGVSVIRTRIFLSKKKTRLGRLAHYASFLVSGMLAARIMEKPDIIFVTSPPLLVPLIGIGFKKRWKVPLITDIRDLWPESIKSVGVVKNSFLIRQAEKLAHFIYKNSSHITATSKGIQKNLPEQAQSKSTVIPNGAQIELFTPNKNRAAMRTHYGMEKKFVVLYTGTIGLAQAPEVLIDAAEKLKDDTTIHFIIAGSGVLLEKIKKAAAEKHLNNIDFLGFLPREEMPDLIAGADVCLIPYKAQDTFRNTLPSKMFDYMAGGKPIIINLAGEASELIEEAECGICIEEENGAALSEAILKLKNTPNELSRLGANGRRFVETNYSREESAAALLKLLQEFQS